MLISMFITPFSVYGQAGFLLSGKIVDPHGKVLNIATLELFTAADSTLVQQIVTKDGMFSFAYVRKGVYLLTVFSEGFDKQSIKLDIDVDKDLLVVLVAGTNDLKEVKISSPKQLFFNHNGNIKVNVENSILSMVANPIDLMAKLPAVQVSADRESLNIIGRGAPLIYLGQQQISMNDLNSLSVSDIKSIEIINNPSAKYEAEGRSVILITRNSNQQDSFKADIMETASFKRYYHNRAGLNLNYKKKKLEIRSNVQYNHLNLWESNSNDFTIKDRDVNSAYRVYSQGPRSQVIVGAGLYYQINESDYLSIYTSKRFQDEHFKISTNSFNKQPAMADNPAIEDKVVTTSLNDDNKPFYNANLNYNKKFKEIKGQLFLGAQYAKFATGLTSSIFNDYNGTGAVLSQERLQHFNVDVWSGRADFEKPVLEDGKWEIGGAVSTAHSSSLFNRVGYNPASASASVFQYKEHIYAAYTQLSGKLSTVTYHAGLRMENTQVTSAGDATTAMNLNYTNFFPKASLDIPLAEHKSLNLGYAKSISRPNYSTASQITTYINPFFEWSRNINIKPEIKDEWSATAQINDKSLALSYYVTKNPVYSDVTFNEGTGILRMAPRNYEREKGISMTLTAPLNYKIWSSTNVVSGVWGKVQDPAATINKSAPYIYAYTSQQLQLPMGYIFTVNGWALSKRNEGVFEHNAVYAVDFGVAKTYFKQLSCTLSYNSLLSTRESTENFSVNGVASKGIYYSDVREFAISMRFSFGKIKDASYKNKEVSEDPDRIR